MPRTPDVNSRVVDGIRYEWDPGRGKWLGPPMPLLFGNLGTVSPGFLRVANNTHTSVLGLTATRNWTVTEASFNNSASVTGTMTVRDGTTDKGSLAITAADYAYDADMDIDLDAGAEVKLYVAASVGTISNVSAMIVVRPRL
jgi:hypothetical protein